ncbi:MAG: dienelactone hydrolase family protein [Phycisphaerae bacterium]|nr:dienelactone hydrolase family protein [Phycisphaerae bacterium]
MEEVGRGSRRVRALRGWAAACALVTAALVGGCASGGREARVDPAGGASAADELRRMSSSFHVRRAPESRGWVLLLPGASGLTIFEDSEHYFRAAGALNERGFDAIVVDYKAAYRAASDPPRVETGGKIAWVARRAIEWARREGVVREDEPGAIVAWSLGGEGLWELVEDEATLAGLNVRAAAAYYPSPEGRSIERVRVPLLVLTGADDDVTRAAEIRGKVEGKGEVEVRVYEGAGHGFDVETIREAREVRLLPLIGPSATFQYNEPAASAARSALTEFLRLRMK